MKSPNLYFFFQLTLRKSFFGVLGFWTSEDVVGTDGYLIQSNYVDLSNVGIYQSYCFLTLQTSLISKAFPVAPWLFLLLSQIVFGWLKESRIMITILLNQHFPLIPILLNLIQTQFLLISFSIKRGWGKPMSNYHMVDSRDALASKWLSLSKVVYFL
jgi:hypothetical protein